MASRRRTASNQPSTPVAAPAPASAAAAAGAAAAGANGAASGASGSVGSGPALWQQVCTLLVKMEKQRVRELQELASLKRLHAETLDMTPGELAQRLPAVKRKYNEIITQLASHASTITSAQTSLTYLISTMEAEERAAPLLSPPTPAPGSSAPSAVATVPATGAGRTALDEHISGSIPTVRARGPLPPLCGAIPASADYICPEGALAAVWHKEQWIVCQVIKGVRERTGTVKYEVEDVDPDPEEPVGEDGEAMPAAQKRFSVTQRHVIPLPTSIPDASRPRQADAEFEAGTTVLALYPHTTCLYQGKVIEPPSKRGKANNYVIEFAGDPPERLEIPQQAVVMFRKKYAKAT